MSDARRTTSDWAVWNDTAEEAVDDGGIQVLRRFPSLIGRPIAEPDLVAWLLEEGRRITRDIDFFDAFCWRVLGSGLPMSRITVSVGTLHPEIFGFGFRWWRDDRTSEVLRVGYGVRSSADYLESPMRPVVERGERVRFDLADAAAIAPYPLLGSLREAGATGYYACPITFFNGRYQATTWATDRPGGFTDADIAGVDRLVPALGAVIEGKALRFIAGTLLDIYLGRTAGRRVLGGEIRRARGETMRAAILVSDMRGFTQLSDRLPGDELIALLDGYFDAVAGPVHGEGGEILKFIGDGMLAIFPLGEGGEREAARRALAAATGALARVAAMSQRRVAAGRGAFRIGIGVHLGEIIFGNVGAADRLDFTAIGPAVNLAARLESLTKRLDRPLLLSRDLAKAADLPLVSLGFHPVKGLSQPEEVFGLPDGAGEPIAASSG